MRVIQHFCPSTDCGVALRSTIVPAPEASLGSVAAPVKCPQCGISFGLWVPVSQAPFVRATELSDPLASLLSAASSRAPRQQSAKL